jgi:hypothetical protein
MYVYIQSEPGLWTVGFYDPQGEWQAESDWGAAEEAASRASWLNGAAAPEAGGEARPVAYRAWLDDERGARWVFTPWPDEEHLEVIWEPLFLAPPTSTAIAARVIRQAAKVCDRHHELAGQGKPQERLVIECLKEDLLALTPANAEAELEALMMKVAEAVNKEARDCLHWQGSHYVVCDTDIKAIVRRVLDENGK